MKKFFTSKSEERAQKRHVLDGRDAESPQGILEQSVRSADASQELPKPKQLSPKEEKEASKRFGRVNF
jgi:hypothetical protein